MDEPRASSSYAIALATREQLPAIPPIERATAEQFDLADLPAEARKDTFTVEELEPGQREGRLWVALDGEAVVGFALAEPLDGAVHLEELDVLPAHQRHGLGRALIEAVCRWARGSGAAAVTLTTFRHVAWNAPYYERRGFRPLDGQELTPGLREALARDERHGLDPARRVAMRREI